MIACSPNWRAVGGIMLPAPRRPVQGEGARILDEHLRLERRNGRENLPAAVGEPIAVVLDVLDEAHREHVRDVDLDGSASVAAGIRPLVQ